MDQLQKELKEMVYNIKDFSKPLTVNKIPPGLKLQSEQQETRKSPRSNSIAPPNKPLQDYLFFNNDKK